MRAINTSAVVLCGALLCLVAVSDATKCDFFKITTGYLEASGGPAGNIACKTWNSLEEAKAECLDNPLCDGFAFAKTGPPYGGCLKKNRAANYNPNGVFDGYHKTIVGCSCDRDYEPSTDICGPRKLGVVSVGKPATQSSVFLGNVASRAVDGTKNPNLSANSCTHTKPNPVTPNPWWKVDLGKVYDIQKIEIVNRGDCCTTRLDNATIRVGDSPHLWDNAVCAKGLKFRGGENKSIECKTKGRYVSIQIFNENNILTLCEVSVYAWVPKEASAPAQLFGLTPGPSATESDNPFLEENEQVLG